MMNLAARARVTQTTFERFRGVAFSWQSAREATCAHALHYHLCGMGHLPPDVPAFRSPTGARRALKEMGIRRLTDLPASLGLTEIRPAQMIVGDIAILPGDQGSGVFDCIAIFAGDNFMGWAGGADTFQAMIVSMPAIKAAFRG